MPQPDHTDAPSVTVVGAGLSGLLCARRLTAAGLTVRVLDKARGTSGRMATRREGALRFDHGAQYFTARSQPFRDLVRDWQDAGVVEEWSGPLVRLDGDEVQPARPARRYVGVPGMSAVGRHLASDLDVTLERRVARVERNGRGHLLLDEGDQVLAHSDAVVLAMPAPQAAALVADQSPALAADLEAVPHTPCWALMVRFAEPLPVDWAGAWVADGPLGWLAREASKPGREAGESWVLHARPWWSELMAGLDGERVGQELLRALGALVGRPLPAVDQAQSHFWAHAQPVQALTSGCLGDGLIGVCGDWCAGARVEGAALSARAVSERLLAALGR